MRSSLSLHRDPTLLRDCPPSTNTFSLWEALNWGLGSWEKISSTCLLFWPGVCTPRLASSLRVQVPDPCYKLADAEKVLLTAGTNLLTTDRGQQPPPQTAAPQSPPHIHLPPHAHTLFLCLRYPPGPTALRLAIWPSAGHTHGSLPV